MFTSQTNMLSAIWRDRFVSQDTSAAWRIKMLFCHLFYLYSPEALFTFYVSDLTVTLAGGGDGGGVTTKNAAEPVTTGQVWNCWIFCMRDHHLHRFGSLDLDWESGHLQLCFVCETFGRFPLPNQVVLKPKPNQSMSTALWRKLHLKLPISIKKQLLTYLWFWRNVLCRHLSCRLGAISSGAS